VQIEPLEGQCKGSFTSASRKSKVRADINSALYDSSCTGTDHYKSAEAHEPRKASRGDSGGEKSQKGGDRPPNPQGGKKGGIPVSERKSRVQDGGVAESAKGPTRADPERTRATTGEEIPLQTAVSEPVADKRPPVVPRKPLKLDKYDGASVPFETYLAKLNNAVTYNQWSEPDKLVFIRDALVGPASQILWELSSEASSQDIIDLLRVRFGSAHNAERYRAE